MADAALALARSTGDPVSVATALSVVQQVCDHPTQLRLIDEALSVLVGDDPDTVELQIILNSLKSYPLAYLGRKEEAQDSLRHAALMAERSGSWRKVDISTIASEHAFEQGNWDDALVTIGSIPREHLEGPSYCYLLGLAARVALHRENRELAIKHLMAAGISDFTKPTSRGRGNGMYLSHAMAMLAQLDGDQRLALNIMRSWLAVDSHNRLYRHYESMTLMRLALACGDRVTAEATADAAGVVAETGTFFVANACARTCAAMLAGDPVELLAIAERHARDGWPEFAAINFEEAATRLAEGNDLQKARTVYTEAVRIYAALGATWDIRRADANMRPYGIRRGSRSLHRREKTGWNALTPTETRIAGLLAQGRSNPDISAELYVSRSTVQTHVSNILGKLQLRSRVELIREVSGRQNG